MKIAVSSDLHLDLNHANVAEIITQQAHYLTRQEIDHYFLWGIPLMILRKPAYILRNYNRNCLSQRSIILPVTTIC